MAEFPTSLKQTSDKDCRAVGLYAKVNADDEQFTGLLTDGSGNLNVNVQSGGTAGAQYNSGEDTSAASTKGTLALGEDGTNVRALKVDSSGHLQVDVLSGGGGGSQYNDGDSFTTSTVGTLALGTDGTNVQALSTDTTGRLNVNPKTVSPATTSGTMTLTLGTVVVSTGNVATKVYAYSLTTTSATAGVEFAFMAGTTRLWEVILQNASGTSVGANLATTPANGSFLFSTVLTNTTLSLSCGSAVPVHFSVAYYQE